MDSLLTMRNAQSGHAVVQVGSIADISYLLNLDGKLRTLACMAEISRCLVVHSKTWLRIPILVQDIAFSLTVSPTDSSKTSALKNLPKEAYTYKILTSSLIRMKFAKVDEFSFTAT